MSTPESTTLNAVRQRYTNAANNVLQNESCGCGPDCCSTENNDPITGNLYSTEEIGFVPLNAISASLGCGNPTALAELHEGETVLDLGSGGGIDVLLSARRVGPTGHAYGVDMLDEMLQLAERNKAEAGVENVTFLKGTIENVPLPDNSVDVIISNCVVNLAVEKGPVLKEAFRVLKPGGRFAISDVVTQGPLPAELKKNMEMWVGCIAGALDQDEFHGLLAEAGFEGIGFQETREYDPAELAQSDCCGEKGCGADVNSLDGDAWNRFEQGGGRMISAFVRATKPE